MEVLLYSAVVLMSILVVLHFFAQGKSDLMCVAHTRHIVPYPYTWLEYLETDTWYTVSDILNIVAQKHRTGSLSLSVLQNDLNHLTDFGYMETQDFSILAGMAVVKEYRIMVPYTMKTLVL